VTLIAHISDTHFGTVDEPVQQALIRDIQACHADVILLTGDITQRARTSQFREARAFLDMLPAVPRVCIPGNHDIPLFDIFTRFLRPYRLFRKFIGTELEPSYEDETVAVICVNATRATRHKHGVVSEQQIARTAERLRQLTQPFRVIAIHQPLAVTLRVDVRNLARGAERALEAWLAAGADLFVGGHIHLPYCTTVRAANTSRTGIVLQAGTAVSRRIRHGVPNSYNRIELTGPSGARQMKLTRCDFDEATQAFETKHVYAIDPVETGWTLLEHRAA
jgi:3',5'-cyclic AMP phosphodiesterase CpdA